MLKIFLPVWFLTLKMILVEVGLGDKEKGLVAKLNWRMYLCHSFSQQCLETTCTTHSWEEPVSCQSRRWLCLF